MKLVQTHTELQAEVCYILIGDYRGGIAHAKMRWRRRGSPTTVSFDWNRVMQREELAGDVVGFYHTHPPGYLRMSARDEKTMRAWAFSFGKPLVCAIGSVSVARPDGLCVDVELSEPNEADGLTHAAWLIDPFGEIIKFDKVEIFKDLWLVASMDG